MRRISDIRALHFPAGHSGGDSVIYFPKSNVASSIMSGGKDGPENAGSPPKSNRCIERL